jgi:polyferredoxin
VNGWRALADAVLLIHFGVVLFVIGGLAAIVIGNLRGWRGVNRPLFRFTHLAAIGFVVAQAWLGQVCPLTTLESWLRARGGDAPYAGGFIEHWLHAVMFFRAPEWVFATAYTAFGALVALAWWRWPPRRSR